MTFWGPKLGQSVCGRTCVLILENIYLWENTIFIKFNVIFPEVNNKIKIREIKITDWFWIQKKQQKSSILNSKKKTTIKLWTMC